MDPARAGFANALRQPSLTRWAFPAIVSGAARHVASIIARHERTQIDIDLVE
jgi:hypothetical protein